MRELCRRSARHQRRGPGSGRGDGALSRAQCGVALELREEIGGEERALGEEDALATPAQLLSEKRIGFLILAFGLSLHLAGLVLEATEGVLMMAGIAVGVILLGLATAVIWVKVGSRKVREEAHEAAQSETGEVPKQ